MKKIKSKDEFEKLIENKVFKLAGFKYQFFKNDNASKDFKINGQSVDKYLMEENEGELTVHFRDSIYPGKHYIIILKDVPFTIQMEEINSKKITELGEQTY